MHYIHKIASCHEREVLLIQAVTWMNIKLSKRNQTQKATCYMIPFIWDVQSTDKSIDTESRLVVAEAGGEGRVEVTAYVLILNIR